MDAVTLRFVEYQDYDPIQDRDVLRLLGISNRGTWYMDVQMQAGHSLRAARAQFKEAVYKAASSGEQPCELEFE